MPALRTRQQPHSQQACSGSGERDPTGWTVEKEGFATVQHQQTGGQQTTQRTNESSGCDAGRGFVQTKNGDQDAAKQRRHCADRPTEKPHQHQADQEGGRIGDAVADCRPQQQQAAANQVAAEHKAEQHPRERIAVWLAAGCGQTIGGHGCLMGWNEGCKPLSGYLKAVHNRGLGVGVSVAAVSAVAHLFAARSGFAAPEMTPHPTLYKKSSVYVHFRLPEINFSKTKTSKQYNYSRCAFSAFSAFADQ